MAGRRDDPTQPHPDVQRYAGIEKEPGFLALVDAEAIAAYKGAVPQYAARWPYAGCKPWFAPGDKDAGGTPCIVAHTQSTRFGVGLEAGATAFAQLLEKRGDERSFRKGAVLSVVFVSDTHEPGQRSPDIEGNRPNAVALRAAAEKANTLAGFRLNAFAPERKCTGEELWGRYYYGLVDATGGFKKDPCELEDYEASIAELVEAAAKPDRPVFVLGRAAREVLAVTVDGKAVADYELNDAKDTITLPEQPADTKVDVEIVYRY